MPAPEARITDLPGEDRFVRFAGDFGQRFLVTVDTEEEFDWNQPLRAQGHTLHSVSRLARFQQFCEGHGVVPVYLVDYPVATSPLAAEVLRDAVAAGRAEVGVQLHPWVSPPHDEEVNEYNSFAGNLPAELENAKFSRLRDAIERAFGAPPRIYRAGRYGVGPNTPAILRDHGIAIDTSVRARFDYSTSGGRNFRDLPVRPWWVDGSGGLMELPLTTVYWGGLARAGAWLYPRLWRAPKLRGALARVGLLERIPLTPEGVNRIEARRGIETAVSQGLPVLVFSFHSPSLEPGHTPYVRTEAELDAFYDWWRAAFTLLDRLQVRPTTVAGIMSATRLA
ncbi:polysaccharide deacetylase family protein [Novosphingobium bradum]|uniref:Polysaccharide deacetylase family protein n=1 Tax=Novosphingobium bradum TaxID=1737444 RepID=A0ABV7IUU9_9SPHN